MQGNIHTVFDEFRNHLKGKQKQMSCFYKYEFQNEGWLKGEFIFLLDKMKADGRILDFERESIAIGRKKIDLTVDLGDGRHFIELKHWLIGKQKNQVWGPNSYFSELENELYKFKAIKAGEKGWICALCTKNPDAEKFNSAMERFNGENSPCKLYAEDSPTDYPETYYFGVINVRGIGV
jgi:hypothetical protein